MLLVLGTIFYSAPGTRYFFAFRPLVLKQIFSYTVPIDQPHGEIPLMTTDTEVLAQLEAFGTEKTRKTYARHGIGANQYGVSYADLGKLKKKIKMDNDL